MTRRAQTSAVDVGETFRWAGTYHVVVVVAPLIRRTLRTFLEQSWLLYECNVTALSAGAGTAV